MVLPARSQPAPKPDPNSLFHPSTFIHSSINDSPLSNPSSSRSPEGLSLSSHSMFPNSSGGTDPAFDPIGLNPHAMSSVQQDALQALVAGELPADRKLVGDGQKLTPQVIELFVKVDAKLKACLLFPKMLSALTFAETLLHPFTRGRRASPEGTGRRARPPDRLADRGRANRIRLSHCVIWDWKRMVWGPEWKCRDWHGHGSADGDK